MIITKEYLLSEIANMERQRNHAHDVAVASQAAIDVMKGLIARLDLPDAKEKEMTFSDLGLADPVPVPQT